MALKTGNSGNNVLVGSSVHDEIWGFQGDDLLKGGGGDDYLNGGTGIDTMYGGTGDNSYNVDNVNDQVVEYEDQGNDTISAQVTYSLNYALQVENLTLTGSADIDGYGNALDNVIKGNSGDNALWGLDGHDHLYGGAGDDYLNGGASYDVMYGGTGDDYYVVDNISDFVTEHAGEGIDTVASSTHFTMFGEIENLILTGSSNIFGHGNELDNQITGNSGGNHIDGGLGADLMKGGDGNDTYEVDNAGDVVMEFDDKGYDKVKVSFDYQLSANVERLSLLGSANLTGKGNDLANDLYGNSGHNTLYGYGGNDDLDGGTGGDTMFGGDGNDVYYIDNAADLVVESANEGTEDFVWAPFSYTLTENVERLYLLDGALNGTGNAGENVIFGNDAENILDGGAGVDYLEGRGGNDTYLIDNAADMIWEGSGPNSSKNDVAYAYVDYVLAANVETLSLNVGNAISGIGNADDNVLYGNAQDNYLNGGEGADQLSGLGGNDTFVFQAGQAQGDTVFEFEGNGDAAGDVLYFTGYGTAADGATFMQQTATDWVVTSADGLISETITLSGAPTIHASDYLFV